MCVTATKDRNPPTWKNHCYIIWHHMTSFINQSHIHLSPSMYMIPSQLFGSPLRPPWVLGSPTGLTDASLAPSTNCIALCQLWEPISDPQLMMSSWSWPCATSKNLLLGCNGWSIDGTWWLIPLSKWVITPVISGLTLLIPFITGVITHLLSGMSHQVGNQRSIYRGE